MQKVVQDGGRQGHEGTSLLPAPENLVVRVSLFDGYTDRWVVLSERIGCKAESKEEMEIVGAVEGKSSQQHRHHCRFPFIGQHVEFAVHFKFYALMKPMTVRITPTVVFDGDA